MYYFSPLARSEGGQFPWPIGINILRLLELDVAVLKLVFNQQLLSLLSQTAPIHDPAIGVVWHLYVHSVDDEKVTGMPTISPPTLSQLLITANFKPYTTL